MKKRGVLFQLFMVCLFLGTFQLFAQPGGRPGGFDPDEMIKREKQNVYNAIANLSSDQKLLLDGIYDEYALSFKELREEMRRTRDFQAMRPKMQALQTEKNQLIKDVLSEEQFEIYMGLIEERRRVRRETMQRRGTMQPGDSTRQRRRNAPQIQPSDTTTAQPSPNQ